MAKGFTNCSLTGGTNNMAWGVITLSEAQDSVIISHGLGIKPTKGALIPNYMASYYSYKGISLGYYGFNIGINGFITGATTGYATTSGKIDGLFNQRETYESVGANETITFASKDFVGTSIKIQAGEYYWFAIVE